MKREYLGRVYAAFFLRFMTASPARADPSMANVSPPSGTFVLGAHRLGLSWREGSFLIFSINLMIGIW